MASRTPVAESIFVLQKEAAVFNERLGNHEAELKRYDVVAMRERLAVLESHVAELKRQREETDRYSRTLLGIGLGAVLSLVGGIVVQLTIRSLGK